MATLSYVKKRRVILIFDFLIKIQKIRMNISPFGEDTRRASMRNTNFKKYAGLFRREPNVANWSQRVGKQKQLIIIFAKPKPPKARSRQSRESQAIGDDYATVEGKVLKICRQDGR